MEIEYKGYIIVYSIDKSYQGWYAVMDGYDYIQQPPNKTIEAAKAMIDNLSTI